MVPSVASLHSSSNATTTNRRHPAHPVPAHQHPRRFVVLHRQLAHLRGQGLQSQVLLTHLRVRRELRTVEIPQIDAEARHGFLLIGPQPLGVGQHRPF